MENLRKVLSESAVDKYNSDLKELEKSLRDNLGLQVRYLGEPTGVKTAVVNTPAGEVRFTVNLGYVILGDKRYRLPEELPEMVKGLKLMTNGGRG